MKKYDIIIIGAGPAGISSAIYAKRAGSSVCVFDNGESKLEKAKEIANYYGIASISGSKLKKEGIKQAKALGIDVENCAIDFAEKDFENNCFLLKTEKEEYVSKAVIIASGEKQNKVDSRLEKYEKQNISSCAICDGYFYKGKTVGVLGNGTYALAEAKVLSPLAKKVYIFTDGETKLESQGNIEVITNKIVGFSGKTKLEKVEFENKVVIIDGLFLALGTMDSLDMAKKLGVLAKDNHIVINDKCETNVKGAYSAGDITGGIKQVATAVYQGMIAGLEASKFVKQL